MVWANVRLRGSRGSKQIALTFDDGPNDPHTLKLLDVLAKHSVRATFFMIGRYVQQRPDIARAVAAGGTRHRQSHVHASLAHLQIGSADAHTSLSIAVEALQDAIGEHSNLFRPPFGGRRPATIRIARELGLQTVMWNVTGYDWNAPPAAVIEKKVARQIRGGDVILLHDGGHRAMGADRAQTVIATDRLIARYKAEGYEFVAIPEMMKQSGNRLALPSE